MLDWMAWTGPTAGVFAGLTLVLAGMGVWGHLSPPVARRGFFRIETDRGDRLYMGLLATGAFLVGWIALVDLSMWLALACAVAIVGVIMRWG